MSTSTAATIEIGQELPSVVRQPTQRRIDAYSTVRAHSIHSDETWAQAKGFRTCLTQGMMSTAYVSDMMTRLLGSGFVRGGTMSIAFVKPVYAGDRLTVRGAVKDKRQEDGRTRVIVEVSCTNQHGQQTAIGTASGLLP
jgi:3-hydroxybutyryl-CoA dehydratase